MASRLKPFKSQENCGFCVLGSRKYITRALGFRPTHEGHEGNEDHEDFEVFVPFRTFRVLRDYQNSFTSTSVPASTTSTSAAISIYPSACDMLVMSPEALNAGMAHPFATRTE